MPCEDPETFDTLSSLIGIPGTLTGTDVVYPSPYSIIPPPIPIGTAYWIPGREIAKKVPTARSASTIVSQEMCFGRKPRRVDSSAIPRYYHTNGKNLHVWIQTFLYMNTYWRYEIEGLRIIPSISSDADGLRIMKT